MEIAVYGFILFGSLGNDIEASEIDFLLKRRLIVKGRKNGRCIRSTDECHNYGMSPAFSLNPNPGEERALSRAVKRYAEYTSMEERQRASFRPRKSQTVIVGASSAAQPSLWRLQIRHLQTNDFGRVVPETHLNLEFEKWILLKGCNLFLIKWAALIKEVWIRTGTDLS